MVFVNEFISAEDVERSGLRAIDDKVYVGRTRARDWTIDRERNIYLRNIASGGGADPDMRNQLTWTLYWRGDILTLRLDLLEASGGPDEPGWSLWKLVWLNGSNGLPQHLRKYKVEIIADLEAALTAYRGSGVYSADYSDYSITLEVGNDCVL